MKDSIAEILGLDLVDYALKIGYKLKKGHLTTNWVTLENPSNNDSIIIKRNGDWKGSQCSVYNNLNPALSQDKGNIINFVLNRINANVNPLLHPTKEEFNTAFTILKEEVGEAVNKGYYKKEYLQHNKISNENLEKELAVLENVGRKTKDYLLKQRCITEETLQRKELVGIIKENPVQLPNGNVFKNTCFIKQDSENKIKGFVSHYYDAKIERNQKRVFEAQDKGVVRTNIFADSKGLIIGESIIDCISHLQIFKNQLDATQRNYVYASFEGNPSHQEIEEIYKVYQKILKQNNNDKSQVNLLSITDNDYQGFSYDLKMAIFIYNQENPNKQIVEYQGNNLLRFVFENETQLQGKAESLIQSMKETILNETTDERTLEDKRNFAEKCTFQQKDNQSIIEIPVSDKKNFKYIDKLTQFIYKHNGNIFKQHKSNLKDWNDELKEITKKKVLQKIKPPKNYGSKTKINIA